MINYSELRVQAQQANDEKNQQYVLCASIFGNEFEKFVKYIQRVAIKDCEEKIKLYYESGEKEPHIDSLAASNLHCNKGFFTRKRHFWYSWMMSIDSYSPSDWDKGQNGYDKAKTMSGYTDIGGVSATATYDFDTFDRPIKYLRILKEEEIKKGWNLTSVKGWILQYFKEHNKFEGDPEIRLYANCDGLARCYLTISIDLPDITVMK